MINSNEQFNSNSQNNNNNNNLITQNNNNNPQQQATNNLNILQHQPQQPQVHKAWHDNITSDMRKHLVQKIIQTIFPTQDHNIYRDPRLANLVGYAIKTECEMYEQAKDQEEYFHLLAERIYKIQKEFEDKQRTRNTNRNLSSSSSSVNSSTTASNLTNNNSNDIGILATTANSSGLSNDSNTFVEQLTQLNNDSLPPPNKAAPSDSNKKTNSFGINNNNNNQYTIQNKLPIQTNNTKDYEIGNNSNHFNSNQQQSNDANTFPRSNSLINISSGKALNNDVSLADTYVKDESNDVNSQDIKKEKIEFNSQRMNIKTELVNKYSILIFVLF